MSIFPVYYACFRANDPVLWIFYQWGTIRLAGMKSNSLMGERRTRPEVGGRASPQNRRGCRQIRANPGQAEPSPRGGADNDRTHCLLPGLAFLTPPADGRQLGPAGRVG